MIIFNRLETGAKVLKRFWFRPEEAMQVFVATIHLSEINGAGAVAIAGSFHKNPS